MSTLDAVQRHYTADDLSGRLDAALHAAGLGDGTVDWTRLAAIDQFHVGGLDATQDLAQALGLRGGDSFLDVGCGFGGPARFLAGRYGCRVTGIDLTPAYIEIARTLARRTGLEERLAFVQGDATDLPFPDGSFDAAWTMHVGMNVEDKDRLYSDIRRVLKPGGRLAVYDILQGDGGPLVYPLPWARMPETSFVATEDEIVASLHAAGFRDVTATDRTPAMVAWMAAFRASIASGTVAINLVRMVLGNDAPEINANVVKNLDEGRAHVVQMIACKG